MKRIIFLMALIAVTFAADAQVLRGNYGTLEPYTALTGTIYNNSLSAVAADTMKGVDTTYLYFTMGNPYKLVFELKTVQKADSLSGTAILQATNNTSNWLTRTSGSWESITGLTSLCTTCTGASKTYTLATGTNYVRWDVGLTGFKYWRIRIVGTRSTDTTAVTGNVMLSY